jgi:essential nuclear protein 1
VEAIIISSILKKRSIPVLYSCAAIERIASMDYSGTNSYFLRVLLDKKYNLAVDTIRCVCRHFLSFLNESHVLPVIWYQSLLVFVQRYKNELTEEEVNSLLLLISKSHHYHYLMSDEIKRELSFAAAMVAKQDPSVLYESSVPGLSNVPNMSWIHHLK